MKLTRDNFCLEEMQSVHCKGVAEVACRSLPERLTEEMLLDTLQYDYNHFLVLSDQNQNMVIGFVGVMILYEEVDLLYIAILPEYRRQGLALWLYQEAETICRANRGERILLEVRQGNEAAISMYRKIGYVDVSVRKDYYSNPTEDALILEKQL